MTTAAFRALDEVSTQLAARYDGPTYTLDKGNAGKFTYIPWHVSVRQLNDIFGVFGWTSTQPQVSQADGIVTVTLAITARVVDAQGTVIEKTVPCVGSAAARDDNSAKSALSDALSKGVKFFGDAFGFFLSEEKRGAASANSAPNRAPQGGGSYSSNGSNGNGAARPGGGKGPSEKQMKMLLDNGYTEEQIAGLGFKEWKGVLEALFAHETPDIAPAGGRAAEKPMRGGSRRQPTPSYADDDVDDLPF